MVPVAKWVAGFVSACCFAGAHGAVEYINTYVGNDCTGGFSDCYASAFGVGVYDESPGDEWSPVVFKRNSSGNQPTGSTDFGTFPSIDGNEFVITYNSTTNVLGFVYTAGVNDPDLHFFTVKQGNSFALFGDTSSAITTWSGDLDTWFSSPGWSHMTFFDTGSSNGGGGGSAGVPEPNSSALALLGVGLLGASFLYRRRQRS